MTLTRIQKLVITGGCMFLFSFIFKAALVPPIVKSQIKKNVALKQGWKMRGIWGKFPFSFEFRFYLFNITNPDEIANGEKPRVQEVGPFIYDEWQEKTNQIDHDEDDSVSSTLRNTYTFNSEKSEHLTGEEELTIPNYFALGLVNTVLLDNPNAISVVGEAIDSIMRNASSMFMKAKVKDILFDGLIINCDVDDFAGSIVCEEIDSNYEELRMKKIDEDIFSMSLWGSMNATDSSKRTRVFRGIKNLMDVGRVVEYDEKYNISVWDDDYCDAFNGTDGTIFHPFFDNKGKDDVVLFNAGLCRSITCHYVEQRKYSGLKLLRYTTNLGTDPLRNPRDKCFCTDPDQCLKKGVFDLYKCLHAPLIVSNPHFYLADPSYLEQVDGLSPDKDKHMIILDIDPLTGLPVYAHSRAQFNMFITKLDELRLMENFPDALLPLFWIDEILVLPDDLLKELKMGHTQVALANMFQYLMMVVSLGLCGYAGYLQYEAEKAARAENKSPEKSKSEKSSAKNITTSAGQIAVLPRVE